LAIDLSLLLLLLFLLGYLI